MENKKNIIRNLFLIPVFICIVLYTVYSFMVLVDSDYDTIQSLLKAILSIGGIGTVCTAIYAIWSGISKVKIFIPYLLIKLSLVPIYILSVWYVVIQMDFVAEQGRVNLILILLAFLGNGIFRIAATMQSGIIGIAAAVNGKREEKLTKKQAVLFSVLGFFPWVDIVIAIVILIKCNKKEEKTA